MSRNFPLGIHPHVWKEYDLELKDYETHKSTIRVSTPQGEFALRKNKVTKEQMIRMNEVVQFLREQSFHAPKIIPNKYGDLFVPTENEMVYFTKWVIGNPLTLNHQPHMLAMVKGMAKMHQLGFSFTPALSDYYYLSENYIRNTWLERLEWLDKYHKKLKRKSSLTTFEHILLTYLPFIRDWAAEAIEHFNQWLIEYNSFEQLRKTISHGRIHHRNVLLTEYQRLVFIDFQYVSMDSPVRDLAGFVRKYILNKEHRNWASQWIKAYEKIVPLKKEEKKLLAIYLLFPERLISLIQNYEKKRRDWPEELYLNKLQIRFAQQKEMLWFIDQSQWLD